MRCLKKKINLFLAMYEYKVANGFKRTRNEWKKKERKKENKNNVIKRHRVGIHFHSRDNESLRSSHRQLGSDRIQMKSTIESQNNEAKEEEKTKTNQFEKCNINAQNTRTSESEKIHLKAMKYQFTLRWLTKKKWNEIKRKLNHKVFFFFSSVVRLALGFHFKSLHPVCLFYFRFVVFCFSFVISLNSEKHGIFTIRKIG